MKLDIINIDNLKKVKKSKYRNRHPLLPQQNQIQMLVKAFDEIYDKTEDDILEVSNDIRDVLLQMI